MYTIEIFERKSYRFVHIIAYTNLFIRLKKAYNSVLRDPLCDTLLDYGVAVSLTAVIRGFY